MAPIAAGAAFAGVMSFEQGGRIPGSGPVPIMAHGGETIINKGLTDRLEAAEGRGGRRPVSITMNVVTKDADSLGYPAPPDAQARYAALEEKLAELERVDPGPKTNESVKQSTQQSTLGTQSTPPGPRKKIRTSVGTV